MLLCHDVSPKTNKRYFCLRRNDGKLICFVTGLQAYKICRAFGRGYKDFKQSSHRLFIEKIPYLLDSYEEDCPL